MNASYQERAARADREILLANLALAMDEPTRLLVEELLQKNLFYIRGLMLAQAIDLCSVPDCLSEGCERRNGQKWCAQHASDQQSENIA
jgi:hypothetical protein